MNSIRINFQLNDIMEALDVVSAVTPHDTSNGNEGAGYLFIVRGEECFLYSNDSNCIARAKFKLIESSGDGSFVFPYKNLVNSLRPLAKEEETCVIEATCDEGSYKVKYITSPDGAEAEFGSFSPDSISRFDDDLESAPDTYEFNIGVLREAISLARFYLAPKTDSEAGAFHGIEVMDKSRLEKSDGYLYASNKFEAFFFRTDHFSGKKLAIHGAYISSLLSFLAKSGETVTIKVGEKTFAINDKGDVFGWSRQDKLHDRFNYHSPKMDSLVVRVNKGRLLNALECARGALNKDQDKIIFNFDADTNKIWFDVPESKAKSIKVNAPYVTEDDEGSSHVPSPSFSSPVSAKQFVEMFQNMKGHEVVFRGYLGKPKETSKKPICIFRTIDEFFLDPATGKVTPNGEEGIACRVTRFVPAQK